MVCSFRAYLNSLIGMPLLVKAIVLEGTLVIISRVIPFAVQTLESVRTRCTSCSCLPRRVRLGIGLVTPSQQSVVLNSVRTTTFLILSALSMTGMCRMSPALAIAILGHSRVHSSPSDCGSIMPKIKWVVNKSLTLRPLLRVPNINPDNRHVRAGWGLHNVRHRGQCDTLKKRRARKSFCHLGRSNRKRCLGISIGDA